MTHKLFSLEDLEGAFDGVRAAMDEDSELACAVLGAAYLEKMLGILLRRFFVESDMKEMFGTGGVLENCGAQNEIAFAVGLISEDTRNNIRLISKIRNDFAHSHTKVSFKMTSIADRCAKLTIFAAARQKKSVAKAFRSDRQKQFKLCVGLTAAYLEELAKRTKHRTHVFAPVDRALGKRLDFLVSKSIGESNGG
jgi:DNA-binding MltR family transcriptional regulator